MVLKSRCAWIIHPYARNNMTNRHPSHRSGYAFESASRSAVVLPQDGITVCVYQWTTICVSHCSWMTIQVAAPLQWGCMALASHSPVTTYTDWSLSHCIHTEIIHSEAKLRVSKETPPFTKSKWRNQFQRNSCSLHVPPLSYCQHRSFHLP